jgi:hypothetical protein
MHARLALCAALLLAGATLDAQVVRGRVTERTTQALLGGVLVELLDASREPAGERVAAVLSMADGTWALRAPAPGRYVITAKRIGVRRFTSAVLQLSAGETVVRDLAIEALSYQLPEVVVRGVTPCDAGARDGSGARVAALWEEARTALVATQVSLRDRLFTARVTRYVRALEPRTRRVLGETRSEATGVVTRPFTAASVDSLSEFGYWLARADGRATYHGPDADVLLSGAFLRDHCFREVRGGRERRGMVGLRFQPVAGRTVPDVVGALWLDARTFELRLVGFHYSRTLPGVDSADVGGEIHFARLPGGAWIIRKWFIRLPALALTTAPLTTDTTTAPWVLVRPEAGRLREEGGEVTAEERRQR